MVAGKTVLKEADIGGRHVKITLFDSLVAFVFVVIAFYLQSNSEALDKISSQYTEIKIEYSAFSEWKTYIQKDVDKKTEYRWDSRDEAKHEQAQERAWLLKHQQQQNEIEAVKSHIAKYHPAIIGAHGGVNARH